MTGDAGVNEQTTVNALVGADEWTIECGRLACGATLADVAWIDIHFNMATNGAEAQSRAISLGDLPAPHFRRYRLGVMFPFGWKWSKESNIWEREGSATPDQGSTVPKPSRVVRGGWNTAELGQQGVPPFAIRCPSCGTEQMVGAHRRKGTPSPGKPPPSERTVKPQARRPMSGDMCKPTAVLGGSYRLQH